ncbi:MAG: YggS family pyridoxal phosphate-dependent enzyme [Elusimicrobium sp.]|jgi:pyridoxal phosphate enzyme (YggS family)|nr:YggS family pyridoxal phosphate-dependent enzyme [Elusimicrobium sp.]
MSVDVINNYRVVLNRVKTACAAAGRRESEVTVLPVIKYAKNDDILTLFNFLGPRVSAAESRLQDAQKRWDLPQFKVLRPQATLHYIGALQSNKIAKIVSLFDFIDSVPDIETARKISIAALKPVKCMIQVKLTERDTQSGVKIEDAPALTAAMKNLKNINLCGLMAIAPRTEDEKILRPLFKSVKLLWDKEFGALKEKYLSLGMSGDLELAVEEGSDLPRVGSAIFGE